MLLVSQQKLRVAIADPEMTDKPIKLLICLLVVLLHLLIIIAIPHMDNTWKVPKKPKLMEFSLLDQPASSSAGSQSESGTMSSQPITKALTKPVKATEKSPAKQPVKIKSKPVLVAHNQQIISKPASPSPALSATVNAPAKPANSSTAQSDTGQGAGSGQHQNNGSGAAQASHSGKTSPPRYDATYLSNPVPDYPAMSREMGEEGRVYLSVQVSAQGKPVQVQLHKSSGTQRLDQAALEAVKHWQFIPGHIGEEPVTASVIVPINFFLD